MEPDAIVIGAGTAGCTVARRLADRGRRVVLIEAGPPGPVPEELRSIDATRALAVADRFWPSAGALTVAGDTVPHLDGRGLGGGSAVNTLVAMVGDRGDYDRWAADHGCTGWGWSDIAPWLDAALATWPGPPASPGPLAAAFGDAALAAGHRAALSSAEVDLVGYAPAALMVADGRRRSMADHHLERPDPAGPELLTGAPVVAVTTRGRTATGVALADGTTIGAGLVVVTAGALRTPRILAASGIIDGTDRPVQDHPSFVFTVELRPRARVGPGRPPVTAVLRFATDGAGSTDATALVMDHVGGSGPDRGRYGAVIVELTATTSRGRLAVGGGEPLRFFPGWLDTPADRARLRAAVLHVAGLLTSREMRPVVGAVLVDDRGTPLRDLLGLDQAGLDRWLIGHPGPVGHAAATCAMGGANDPGAVVDLDGSVPGWHGIHVADASVLPVLPAANPQVPVMAVAERLARQLH